MKKTDYDDLAERIKSGQVVEFNGRSAATIEELDFIKSLPDVDGAGAVITTYDHGAAQVLDALEPVDEVGQRAQDFNPALVAATSPGNGEPGPTAVNAPLSPDDSDTSPSTAAARAKKADAAAPPAPASAVLPPV